MSPQISVIIPTYNAEGSIQKTVNSVLTQSYSDFELIIVDDGSTDGTLEVVEKIDDPRIRVFRYPHAGVRGPAVGRNRGLSHARGELISFLDHDDIWHPEKLALQMRALHDSPNAAVAYSWVDIIDESDNIIGAASRTVVNGNAFHELLKGCFPWTGSNPLVRKSALEFVGPFDIEVGSADDWDMWLRLSEEFSFVCVEKPHVRWRRTSRNTSCATWPLYNSNINVLNRAFSRNPDISQYQRDEALKLLNEGVMSYSASGNPTLVGSRITVRLAFTTIWNKPTYLLEVWRKPWILRAIVKSMVVIILRERGSKAIFDLARSGAAFKHSMI